MITSAGLNNSLSIVMKRWILRALVALVLLGLGYLLVRLVVRFWGPALFWVYIIVGLFIAVLNLVNMRRFWIGGADPAKPDLIVAAISRQNWRTSGRLERIRMGLSLPLLVLQQGLGWPAAAPAQVIALHGSVDAQSGGSPVLRQMAAARLHSAAPISSMLLFAWLLVVCALHPFLSPPSKYHVLFTMGLLISLVAELMVYTIGTVSLGQKLRVAIGRPYLKFLQIAVFSFFSLVLGFTLLEHRQEEHFPRIPDLLATANDILNPTEWIELFRLGFRIDITWLTNLSGLVFSAAILSTLLQYKDFVRTDKDRVSIAASLVQLRKPNEALNYLESVTEKNSFYYQTRGLALLSVNDVTKALDAMERSVDDSVEPSEVQRKAAFDLMIASVTLSLGKVGITSLFRRAAELDLTFSQVAVVIGGIKQQSILSGEQLLDIFESEPTMAAKYPLARAALLLHVGRREESKQLADTVAADTPVEQAALRIFRFQFALNDPETSREEDQEALNAWMTEEFRELRELAGELATDQERAMIVNDLFSIRPVFALLEPERQVEIVYLASELQRQVTDPDISAGLLLSRSIAQRMREKLLEAAG